MLSCLFSVFDYFLITMGVYNQGTDVLFHVSISMSVEFLYLKCIFISDFENLALIQESIDGL